MFLFWLSSEGGPAVTFPAQTLCIEATAAWEIEIAAEIPEC